MPTLSEWLIVAHVACAVVGIGGSLLVRSTAHRPNASVLRTRPPVVVDVAIYGVLVFGLGAVWAGSWDWEADWITLGFVFYVAWLGAYHGLIRRNDNTLPSRRVLTQVRWGEALASLALIGALVVMVAKPSF